MKEEPLTTGIAVVGLSVGVAFLIGIGNCDDALTHVLESTVVTDVAGVDIRVGNLGGAALVT